MGPQGCHRGLPGGAADAGPRAPALLPVQQLVVAQQRDVHQPGVRRVEDRAILPPARPETAYATGTVSLVAFAATRPYALEDSSRAFG